MHTLSCKPCSNDHLLARVPIPLHPASQYFPRRVNVEERWEERQWFLRDFEEGGGTREKMEKGNRKREKEPERMEKNESDRRNVGV